MLRAWRQLKQRKYQTWRALSGSYKHQRRHQQHLSNSISGEIWRGGIATASRHGASKGIE